MPLQSIRLICKILSNEMIKLLNFDFVVGIFYSLFVCIYNTNIIIINTFTQFLSGVHHKYKYIHINIIDYKR